MSRKKTRQIFVFSDPHFNHEDVIKFANRPFKDLDHQREEIKKRWNRKVKEGDLVYVLGDVFYNISSPEEEKKYLDSLNGKKILIKGNHDAHYALMRRCGFDEVYEQLVITIGKGMVFRMCHYPYRRSLLRHLYFNLRHRVIKMLKIKGIRSWSIPLKSYLRRPKRPFLTEEVLLCGHTHSEIKRIENMINCCGEAWGYGPIHINEIIKLRREYEDSKPFRLALSRFVNKLLSGKLWQRKKKK